jgi:hypothetical protein
MHAQELVLNHAFGMRTRSAQRKVVDSFEPGMKCREKVMKLMSFIMNKKSKGRFGEYQRLLTAIQGEAGIVLELPNLTRVAGTYRMFVSCLRSKRGIEEYCARSKEADKIASDEMGLTRSDWLQISEFEAILKICHDLAMESQVEQPGSNCYSYYAVAECRNMLKNAKHFEFIDPEAVYLTSLVREQLPKKSYRRTDMQGHSLKLLERLDIEYGNYFKEPDEDQLLAMFFHPFIVCSGYK